MADYAHPDSLVDTQWVADHGSDANVRLIEVDVDTSAYEQGHIAGAVGWNWQSQLQQSVRRDLVSKSEMEELLGSSGVSNDTTVVLYGDNSNWFACWAFWQMKYYGHADVRIMNGGRAKWEAGRPSVDHRRSCGVSRVLSGPGPGREPPRLPGPGLGVGQRRQHFAGGRALPRRVQRRLAGSRQPAAGRLPAGRPHPRRGQRPLGPGHQRGWHVQVRRRLADLYGGRGIDGSRETVAYCRIGERSSTPGSCLPSSWATAASATTTAPGPSGAASSERPSKSSRGSARALWSRPWSRQRKALPVRFNREGFDAQTGWPAGWFNSGGLVQLRSGYQVEAGVGTQRLWYDHRAVGLLVVFQNGDDDSRQGQPGAVEGVNELRLSPCSRRNRMLARRAWKSVQLEQELTSSHSWHPAAQTSMS